MRSLAVVILLGDCVDRVNRVVGAAMTSRWVKTVLVFDNGSSDGTRKELDIIRCASEGGVGPNLKVVRQPRRCGKGLALAEALASLTRQDGKYVALYDTDFDYIPADYTTYLYPLLSGGADVVCGSRFETGGYIDDCGVGEYVRGRITSSAANMLAGTGVSDIGTGFRVMRREVLDSLTLTEAGSGVHIEMSVRIKNNGWRVQEVGVRHEQMVRGTTRKSNPRGFIRSIVCATRHSLLHRRPNW